MTGRVVCLAAHEFRHPEPEKSQSFERHLQIVAGYPSGQQWDIRREALSSQELADMLALPFPPLDPIDGKHGPLVELWLDAA